MAEEHLGEAERRCVWCGGSDAHIFWPYRWVRIIVQESPEKAGRILLDRFIHSLDGFVSSDPTTRDCFAELQRAAEANGETVGQMLQRLR